jgi:hypothetical protein
MSTYAEANLTWRELKLTAAGEPLGFEFFNDYLAQAAQPNGKSIRFSISKLLRCTAVQYACIRHDAEARAHYQERDLPEVISWAASQILTSAVVFPKVTWQSVLRRQQVDAADRANAILAKLGNPQGSWTSPIASWTAESVTAVALTSVAQLAQEGAAMRHCVASRFEDCISGSASIYHLSDIIGRRATLQLKVIDGKWVILEIKGPANTAAAPSLVVAANDLARTLNEAARLAA